MSVAMLLAAHADHGLHQRCNISAVQFVTHLWRSCECAALHVNTILPLTRRLAWGGAWTGGGEGVHGGARWQANMHSKSIQIDPFRAQVMHGECNFMIARVRSSCAHDIDNDMMAKWI